MEMEVMAGSRICSEFGAQFSLGLKVKDKVKWSS